MTHFLSHRRREKNDNDDDDKDASKVMRKLHIIEGSSWLLLSSGGGTRVFVSRSQKE